MGTDTDRIQHYPKPPSASKDKACPQEKIKAPEDVNMAMNFRGCTAWLGPSLSFILSAMKTLTSLDPTERAMNWQKQVK